MVKETQSEILEFDDPLYFQNERYDTDVFLNWPYQLEIGLLRRSLLRNNFIR